ncbi:hypothetical protein GCM10009614_04170 [Glutamicibacter uratoxydans]
MVKKASEANNEPAKTSSAPKATTESLVAKVESDTPVAGIAGQCDTNENLGSVNTFMQKSDETEFHNGNEQIGLYEGGVVHQRVEMTLPAGENELVITYQVKKAGTWAYDYLLNQSAIGANITGWQVIQGAATDDQVNTVKITLQVDGTAGQNYPVTLYFDAHIASELDHGPGTGASSISGSPYHVTLDTLNCASTGSRDNQIKASDVQAGVVTIVKEAEPADGTDFDFTLLESRFHDSVGFKLDDSANSDTGAALDQQVTYTVTPSTVTITENDIPAGWNLDDIQCTNAQTTRNGSSISFALVDDQEVTCTFYNNKTTYKDLTLTKSAIPSFDRDYDWEIEKKLAEGQDSTIKSSSESVDVDYDVVVTPSAAQDANFKVKGTITVTNPNDTAMSGVTLADQIGGTNCVISTGSGPISNPISVPSGSTEYTYSCDMPDGTTATSSGTNNVTATWDEDAYYGTDGSADASAPYDFSDATPTVTDEEVTITDDKLDLSGIEGGNIVNATDGPRTFHYTIEWTGEAGKCLTENRNTATLSSDDGKDLTSSQNVEICVGANLSVEKLVVSSFNRSYDWDIVKEALDEQPITADPNTGEFTANYKITVTPKQYTDSDWAMYGTISVQNPNDWQDVAVTVDDQVDLGGGVACTVTGVKDDDSILDADPATPGFQTSIAKGATVVFNYSCIFDGKPASYDGSNKATVSWDADKAFTTDSSAAKTVPVTADSWTQTPLNNQVEITDNPALFDDPWLINYSDGEQSRTYSYTWTVDRAGTCQQFTNVATLTGNSGLSMSDSAVVEGCREAGLSVTKDVTATYDRTYEWSIDKKLAEGQPAKVVVDENGNATVNYEVEATNTGYTDSDTTMSGTITVANPNDFTDVAATVSDINTFSAACTFEYNGATGDGSLAVTVPKSGSVTVNYTCDVSSVTEADYTGGTNTAKVTWGDGLSKESAAVPVTFTRDQTTDDTVKVYDDQSNPSGNPKLLGEASFDESPRSFSYTITYQAPTGGCAPFTNKAWVDVSGDEDPSDTQTVEVCDQENLTVSKTVDASYERDYDWSIDKQVDKTRFTVAGNGQVTAHYTVTATPSGPQDSAKSVSGSITINNPNTMVGELTATVEDIIDVPGAACAINGTDAAADAAGFQVVLEDGGSAILDYDCLIPAGTDIAGSYTNTAKVTWGKDREASAPVEFTFTEVKTTDAEVQVLDDKTVEGDSMVLGTAKVSTQPNVFSYDLQLSGVAGTCTDYTNTAVVQESTAQGDENSASATTTVCAGADLSVLKNVVTSFDRSYLWNVDKEALSSQPLTADPATGEVTADYRVTVTPTGHEDSSWAMSGQITVANDNDWQDVSATVVDMANLGDGVTCTITGVDGENIADADINAAGFQLVIERSTTLVLNYNCQFTQQPAYDGSNTATVTWDAQAANTVNGESSFEAQIFADDWSQTPKNDSVTVTDSHHDFGEPWVVHLGDSPESMTRDYSVTWTVAEAGACQEFTNIAVINGNDGFTDQDSQTVQACREAGLGISKTVNASYDRTYQWTIDKSLAEGQDPKIVTDGEMDQRINYEITATNTGFEDSGWELNGVITVTNPNDYTGIDATLADTVSIDGVECTLEQTQVSIPANGSVDVGYWCDVSSGVAASSYQDQHNTVTATWSDQRTASAKVDFNFAIDQQTDREITVWDDQADPAKDPVALGTVSIDQSPQVFEYQLVLHSPAGQCASYTNTAWVDVTGEDDPRDSATVELCGKLALALGKDASASFDRTYLWDLDKKVDRTEVTVDEDGTADFSYTVSALPDGFEDSGFEAHGVITIENPNQFSEADTVATVTDTVDIDGVTCTIDAEDADAGTAGLQIAVPAGAQLQLPYSCDGTPKKLTGTNTVAISWGEDSTATADAAINYTLDQETNAQITVVDDKTDPANPVELGTANWNAQGTPIDFDYTLRHQAVAGECTDFTNTAVILQTGATDSTTVTLCGQKSLVLSKTATALYNQDYEWAIDKQVDQTKLVANEDGSITAHYTVEARTTGVADENLRLNGTLTVQNPNEFGSITATLEDRVSTAGATCTIDAPDADAEIPGLQVVLEAGQVLEADYGCTLDPDLGVSAFDQAVNTVSATFGERTASAQADINFTVDKVTDQSVTVTDDKMNPEADPVVLGTVDAADAPKSFEYDMRLTPAEGTCTVYTNTAKVAEHTDGNHMDESSVDLQLCKEADLTIAKTAAGSYHRDFDWKVSKNAEKTEFMVGEDGRATASYTVDAEVTGHQDSDWAVAGSITVVNPNDYKDTEVALQDNLSLDSGSCTFADVVDGKVIVKAGESLVVDYDCTFDAPLAESDYDSATNSVTATWQDDEGEPRTVTAAADIAFSPRTLSDDSVTVIDDMTDPQNPVELGTVNADDEKVSFVYDLELNTAPGTCSVHTNTAWIEQATGNDDDADSVDVTLCAQTPVALTTQAAADFDRQYLWEIGKVAADDQYTAKPGGDITVGYTVNATPQGVKDTGHEVTGTISFSNPNAGDEPLALTLDQLGDVAGMKCRVDAQDLDPKLDGIQLLVPAGAGDQPGVLDIQINCEGAPTALSGAITVKASYKDADGIERRLSAEAKFEYQMASEKDKVITVSDDQANPQGDARELGQATWNEQGTPQVFTYDVVFKAPNDACITKVNTATIVQTGQQDAASVNLCAEEPPVVAPPAPRPPLAITGVSESMLWLLGASGAMLVAGALMLLQHRRRQHP